MIDRPRTGIMSDTYAGIRTDLILFVLGFFLTVFIGNRFGPGGLGFFSMALTMYVLGVLACSSGVTHVFVPKLTGIPKNEQRRLVTTALLFVVVFGLAATVFGFMISRRISQAFDIYDLWRVVCLVSLAFVPGVFNETICNFLAVLDGHKTANRYRMKKRIIFLCVAVVMSVTKNIYLVLTAFFISDLILTITLIRRERAWFFPLDFSGFSETAPGLLLSSVRRSFSGSAGEVNVRIDVLIIGYFMSASSVGVYAVAILVTRLILLPWEVIREVMLTRPKDTGDTGIGVDAKRGIRGYFAYGTAAMLVIAVCTAILYKKIIGVIFPSTHDYLASTGAFLFLLPGVVLYGATTIYEGILVRTGKSETVGIISIQTLLINFILSVLMVHAFGIYGAALAGTLSFFWYYLAMTETLNDVNMPVDRWTTILYGIVAAGIAVILVDLLGESFLVAVLAGVTTLLMLVFVGYLDLSVEIGNVTPMNVIEKVWESARKTRDTSRLH
ncbi:MAG: polysaccharide biosynthesis C-terminal domain-containing protein [Deltaproteobacteria bacterium]|nr:polysaccharide biosynthesis C-terminal domain-containing protein [Candidatus Zymogenaceae bacterium]